MDRNALQTFALRQIEQREKVLVDRVHAARANESQEVQSPVFLLYVPASTHEGRIGVEASVGDGRRDAYKILHHHASGAEIQVSDLAVAHLPFGQADAKSGSFEQRARAAAPERIPGRGVGECDCVAVSFGAVAPSIEYDERDWPRAL